jgi:hypothetical protein
VNAWPKGLEEGLPVKILKPHASTVLLAVALLVLPLLLQPLGNAWVRIVDVALIYVLLALGLNIVVGFAGLLDLGYVAFLRLVLIFMPCWPRLSCWSLGLGYKSTFRKACTPRGGWCCP